MSDIKTNKVMVVKSEHDTKYRLRIYFDADRCGMVMFETRPEFSKAEADYRAIQIASLHGLDRDELPTHPYVMPYPKE